MENATVIGGSLNLRKDTDIKSVRIASIPDGSNVAVLEKGLVWCKVVYNAYTGYVMGKYLKFDSDEDDNIITLNLSEDTAKELYEALKASLNV